MVVLCFVGIFISTFSLSLVLAIMSGFEKGTHEKLRSIHPQIIMQPYSGTINFSRVQEVIDKEFPMITASSPTAHAQALLVSKKESGHLNRQTVSQAVLLKAIDPIHEQKLNTIYSKIVFQNEHPVPLNQLLTTDSIILGKKLAQHCNVQPGDSIELWHATEADDFEKTTVTISGLFATGMEEFDCNLVYCSFSLFDTLFPQSGITHLQMQLDTRAQEETVITSLKHRFKMHAYSWKDLYPALVSALQLQKYAMFFVLALITLVASINMLALLSMFMLKKKIDIAVLTMIGATQKTITVLFMLVGMTISFFASICALALSLVCSLVLKKFPFIQLPDTYYVTHLPVSIEIQNFILVWCVTMVICMIACWYATRGRSVHILSVLKGEE